MKDIVVSKMSGEKFTGHLLKLFLGVDASPRAIVQYDNEHVAHCTYSNNRWETSVILPFDKFNLVMKEE